MEEEPQPIAHVCNRPKPEESVAEAMAQPEIQANGPPGLRAAKLPELLAKQAKTEVLKTFKPNGKPHEAFEIGRPLYKNNGADKVKASTSSLR